MAMLNREMAQELDRLKAVEREHVGGDEHHKGCARELAFMTEAGGYWKTEARHQQRRIRELTAALAFYAERGA